MDFVVGFLVWIIFGVVAGLLAPRMYRAAGTDVITSVVLAVCGSFIGGMLGSSAHVFHDATPLRIGGLLGAFFGAFFFSLLYHFIARKAV